MIEKFNNFRINEELTYLEKNIQIHYHAFSFFVEKKPPMEMVIKYFNGDSSDMQDYIVGNLKEGLFWSTGVGVLDAVDLLINEAESNGNFKNYSNMLTDLEFDKRFGTEYKDYMKNQRKKDFNL